jgi:hypothetical protein
VPEIQGPVFRSARVGANTVFGAPTYSVQLYANRYWDGQETVTSPLVAIGLSGSIYNAPLNLGLAGAAIVYSYVLANTPLTPDISAALRGYIDLWQTRNLFQ